MACEILYFIMANTLGYMITWTTYGTWLQGHKKGWVKDGEVLEKREGLRRDNELRLVNGPVRFGMKEKRIVHEAVREEAERLGLVIKALAVCSNHVHVVYEYCTCEIVEVVRHFKYAGRIALKEHGVRGSVWADGYDKRFCFDQNALNNRIEYVNRHRDD